MSTTIKLRCLDQVLTFESTPVIASGGLEEDFIQVDFCSKWDGLNKYAVFWRSKGEAYHVPLDASDSCAIPHEVLTDEGVIYFGLFGVSADGRQRTSEAMRYTVAKGAITEGTKPSDPTPDIYTDLLTKYLEMVDIAADTRAKEQAFEQAMAAAQAAFEQSMAAAQTAFEQTVDADQAAFEQAMQAAQAAFEKEIEGLIADGLLPDGSVTEEKLAEDVRELLNREPEALTAEELRSICSGLPSGFTLLSHIESTGGAYINLGITPKYNTRVELEIEGLSTNIQWLFGSRDAKSAGGSNQFCLVRANSSSIRADYFGGVNASISVSDATGRTTIDYNANVLSAFGLSAAATAATSGACSYPMYLFAINDGGAVSSNVGSFKALRCRVYEGDVLVSNCVSCKNASGAVGLYDKIHGEFHGNEGSGEFVAGDELMVVQYEEGHVLNGAGLSTLWELFGEEIATEGVKIETGSYVGTGTNRDFDPTKVTVGFTPKALILQGPCTQNDMINVIMFYGTTSITYLHKYDASTAAQMTMKTLTVAWSSNAVSWYCASGAMYQFNAAGTKYNYIAIG